jgi:hypothetical protein
VQQVAEDLGPHTAERHCSKQYKAYVLDRAVEIHLNASHF